MSWVENVMAASCRLVPETAWLELATGSNSLPEIEDTKKVVEFSERHEETEETFSHTPTSNNNTSCSFFSPPLRTMTEGSDFDSWSSMCLETLQVRFVSHVQVL